MNKPTQFLPILTLIFLTALPVHAESPIEGIWRHSEKPAWLEFTFISGVGNAYISRHDQNANAEGLLILKDITASAATPCRWQGKIYDARSDTFVKATLHLFKEHNLEITFKNGTEIETLTLKRSSQ